MEKKESKNIVWIVLVVLLLISNTVTAYFLVKKEETQEATIQEETVIPNEGTFLPEESEEIEMDIPELQSAKIGEEINLGNYSITILQVLDPNEDAPRDPIDGYRFVAAEILLENNTDSSVYYYSDWTAYDTEGYDFSTYGFNYKTPSLSPSGSIAVNATAKGWINFRLTEDAEISSIRFNETRENIAVDFVLEENQE